MAYVGPGHDGLGPDTNLGEISNSDISEAQKNRSCKLKLRWNLNSSSSR